MKSKITLKDIANELSVSTSTVSKALHNSREISKELREKIKAFAKFYHYRPNSLALKLRNSKTMIIGVVIPEIVHHFFSEIISGVEKFANGKDYNVMICLSNESYQKEKLNIEMLANGSVDGLLVSIATETLELGNFNHFKVLEDYSIPLVLFDRVSDDIHCDKVIVDDVGGAYKATRHLIEDGCERIAILTTPDFVTVGALRTKGYLRALKEGGRIIDESLIIKVNEKFDINKQIEVLINQSDLPDGIFAVNEIYAAKVMKIVKEKKLRIPEDIAIIGFTDGLISEFSTPALSTVAQHGFMMGEYAAEILLERIQKPKRNEESYKRKVISTNLRIRNSTKKKVSDH